VAVVQRVHPLPKGWRVNRSYANHSNLPRAIDYGAPIGTPVFAAQNGVVETAVDLTTSYGTHVVLKHAGGAKTIYAHMIRGSLRVKSGDVVRAGTQLGKLGATGNADGAHLHFEVRGPGGGTIDPAVWLAGASNVGESSDQTGVGGQTTVDEKVYPLPETAAPPARLRVWRCRSSARETCRCSTTT
jgi:murein DD-endopeptidase MepM/ murein hydrolase activator NlpD